jgi:hypothetical protein
MTLEAFGVAVTAISPSLLEIYLQHTHINTNIKEYTCAHAH